VFWWGSVLFCLVSEYSECHRSTWNLGFMPQTFAPIDRFNLLLKVIRIDTCRHKRPELVWRRSWMAVSEANWCKEKWDICQLLGLFMRQTKRFLCDFHYNPSKVCGQFCFVFLFRRDCGCKRVGWWIMIKWVFYWRVSNFWRVSILGHTSPSFVSMALNNTCPDNMWII